MTWNLDPRDPGEFVSTAAKLGLRTIADIHNDEVEQIFRRAETANVDLLNVMLRVKKFSDVRFGTERVFENWFDHLTLHAGDMLSEPEADIVEALCDVCLDYGRGEADRYLDAAWMEMTANPYKSYQDTVADFIHFVLNDEDGQFAIGESIAAYRENGERLANEQRTDFKELRSLFKEQHSRVRERHGNG